MGHAQIRMICARCSLADSSQPDNSARMDPAFNVGAISCALCAENAAADRGDDPWAVARLSTGLRA
jgi:hypothetical protein